MRHLSRLFSLMLVLSVLAGNLSAFALEPTELSTPDVPAPDEIVRVIVLLEDQPEALPPEAGFKAEQRAMARHRNSTRQAMEETLPLSEVQQEFSILLNGFSVDIPYSELDTLRELPGVEAVCIAQTYEAPVLSEEDIAASLRTAADQTGAGGSGTLIAILDTGLNLTHEAFRAHPDILGQTVLEPSDVESAGTSVCGTYVSPKIPFAYDYAHMDGDVTDFNGHGTHVAGIAAGCAPGSFYGEAPGAQLAIMKVFRDHSGSTSSDIYFKALEDAYLLGVDVVSMSLGTPGGFTYDDSLEGEIFGNIYRRLQDAGIILCAAGGNSGTQADRNTYNPGTVTSDYTDYGTVASPGTFRDNLAVAAATNDRLNLIPESSLGTTPDLTIAPAVSAVGDQVFSAAITGDDKYRPSSGTSMATPAVSGQLAVILSRLKETAPGLDRLERAEAAEDMLLSSALILGSQAEPISVRNQGAGLSDSQAALGLSAYLAQPLLELGDDPSETGIYHMALTLTAAPGCPMSRFTDVDPDAWYHEEVDYAVTEGLFKGTTDTTFDPEGILTRGQTVTVLHRLSGSPAPEGTCAFSDVRKGSYYEKAITWAQEMGIVKGVTDTTFRPDDPVTREQLVTMLHRYLDKPAGTGDLSRYADEDQIGKYARAAMLWATDAGIITGYTDNTLRPLAGAARCQFSAILYRQLGGSTPSVTYQTFATVSGDSVRTDEKGIILNTLTSRPLDCTVSFSCGDSLTLQHGRSKTVSVTVALAPEERAYLQENFPNGTFVEGHVGLRNEDETIHATFLSFFGNWEEAPILEQYDFRDAAQAQDQLRDQGLDPDYRSILPMNTDVNMAWLYCASSSSPYYGRTLAMAGDNPFDQTAKFDSRHIALSPGLSGSASTYATELLLRIVQLRNARTLTMTVTDSDTGRIYYQDTKTYLSKSIFSTSQGNWPYTTSFRWSPTDSVGHPLPHGTNVTVTVSASLKGEPARPQWVFDGFIDAMAPTVNYSLSGGILTVTARDESYLSCLCISDETGTVLTNHGFSDSAPGTSHTITMDVSGLYGPLTIEAVDYATNVITETVALG